MLVVNRQVLTIGVVVGQAAGLVGINQRVVKHELTTGVGAAGIDGRSNDVPWLALAVADNVVHEVVEPVLRSRIRAEPDDFAVSEGRIEMPKDIVIENIGSAAGRIGIALEGVDMSVQFGVVKVLKDVVVDVVA